MSGRMDTEHDIFKYQDHAQDFKLNPSSVSPHVIALATDSSYILSMMLADWGPGFWILVPLSSLGYAEPHSLA